MHDPSPKPSLFLSYTHADAELARALSRELTTRGARVWTDVEQLRPGDRWAARIEEAIRRADVFLMLITRASEQSKWMQRELATALATAQGTKVVPVRLGGANVPAPLRDILWLDADPNDLATTAERVLHVARVSSPPEASIAEEIEHELGLLGLEWHREPTIAGVRPDFLVELEGGRRLIIEVKSRSEPSLVEAVDARTQAARIRDLTGADAALVVFPRLETPLPAAGIVGLGAIGGYIRELLEREPSGTHLVETRPEPEVAADRRSVFAAMPFQTEYDDVYWVAMTAAARAVDAACIRIDREDFEGDIATKVREMIENSVAVIADLSESNPNVLYEIGYAHALAKPCVPICSTPLDKLPFDVRNLNTLAYSKGNTWALREPLIGRLCSALES